MNRGPATLLAACGNAMAGDDGFGPRVLQCIAAMNLPGVEVLDLSLQPAALLEHLPDRGTLILVDAAVIPGHPHYELLDLDCSDVNALPLCLKRTSSTHDLGLAWQLTLAQTLGMLPPLVRLIVLAVPEPTVGAAFSNAAESQVQPAADMVLQWIPPAPP